VRVTVKIVRVLNTNAVVNIDQEGRELIITGAGIGFKKKKGENLDEALADKTYYLESVDEILFPSALVSAAFTDIGITFSNTSIWLP